MRPRFYLGIAALVLLEVAGVWFIMPLPGSQRVPSLTAAYLLYRARWPLRIGAGLLALSGLGAAWRGSRLVTAATTLAAAGVVYAVNFKMAADHMFLQPKVLRMAPATENQVPRDRLVVGIELEGQARAYPLQFIGYHHQVRDTLSGKPLLVTYCTVCRTGRIFAPLVDGNAETFRLVGMDRFNAMFEDRATGSWWRQANGEAVTGPLKGTRLPEYPSRQVTLGQWLSLYPNSLVMQADPSFADQYTKDYAYENGTSRKALTGTDTASWHEKSWVVGITINGRSRAYDWNRLRRERVVNDTLGATPVVLALDPDEASFFAFVRPDTATRFVLRGDSLAAGAVAYAFNGRGPAGTLLPLNASQEFWHSWRTFQPATTTY